MKKLRILFLGDVVGSTGRAMYQKHIESVISKYSIDGVVVNGENSAHGHGVTSRIMKFFKQNRADVVTSGNHIWRNKEIYSYLSENQDLLRPANFPRENPGVGVTTFMCKGYSVAVVNLQGRVFMRELVACPFKTAESILTYLQGKTNMIFVDFHAETTAEKIGLGFFLDGKVSGVVGTHTHVQTADERILPQGTAFITDLGMAGSRNSMLGMKKDAIIRQMITQMPTQFEVEITPPVIMTGAWIDVDVETGRALAIERISVIDNDLCGSAGE